MVLLPVGLAVFLLRPTDFFGLMLLALLVIFVASQIFWIGHILDLGVRFIPGKPRRAWLTIVGMTARADCRGPYVLNGRMVATGRCLRPCR